jgi:hypothetical protein
VSVTLEITRVVKVYECPNKLPNQSSENLILQQFFVIDSRERGETRKEERRG